MKRLTAPCLGLVMACLLLLTAVQITPAADLPASGALTPAQALEVMKSLVDKLAVVDVRTPEEFAQGHVPGALLLPVQTLEEEMDKVPADRPVLLLCRTGHRAGIAYKMIRKARPDQKTLWFLKGIPVYAADGTFSFR